MLDQVEERFLGPVDVVEDGHERPLAGELLQQAPRRREYLVARSLQHALVAAGLSERLADRRERRALTVGRAAGDHHARVALDGAEELARQPRLADAGVADDGHQAGARRGGLVVGGSQPLELDLLTDEGRVVAARDRGRIGVDGLETERNRLVGLALQRQRIEWRRLHGVLDETVRRLAEDDLARRGRLLEPLADGDGVAADEPVAGGGIRGHDFPRVEPDPHLQRHVGLAVELGDAAHGRRRPRARLAARRPRALPARRKRP